MGDADPRVQEQWNEQQGILHTARCIGKELLLQAAQVSGTGVGGDIAAADTVGARVRTGGTTSNQLSRSRAETPGGNRYGCGIRNPSLHSKFMIDLTKVRNYYIACGYTDLRCGIDGLAAVVTQQYGGQLTEESLFLFCGRRTDRIKALYWSGDGYILLYKRLSNGRFQWPRSEAELRLLDPQSFRWLMEGLRIEQKTAIRKGKPKDLF